MRGMSRLATLLLVLALIAVACGDDDAATTVPGEDQGGFSVTTVAAAATTTSAAAGETPATGGDLDAGTNAGPIDNDLTPAGRLIIFTANIAVEVVDAMAAAQQAQTALSGLGGFLFGQETTTDPVARSVLTLKVPPENFAEALRRLGGLGRVTSQSVFADDVTERVVDVESRISTAEASVLRLRALLEAAADIEDVVDLEAELLERETSLEVLRGQLRTLEDQVALATITLVLSEPDLEPEPALDLIQTAYLGHDAGEGCPGGEDLDTDEGDQITLCIVVENTGDTTIAELELRDNGFDADPDDFLVVEGDPSGSLPPGGRVIFALEAEAEPRVSSSLAVEAKALDDTGAPLRVSIEVDIEHAAVTVAVDNSLPGFMDALAESWEALQRVFGVGVVVAGALVPFLWILLLAAAIVIWRRRRAPVRSDESAGNLGKKG
jgi:hypothetical protein